MNQDLNEHHHAEPEGADESRGIGGNDTRNAEAHREYKVAFAKSIAAICNQIADAPEDLRKELISTIGAGLLTNLQADGLEVNGEGLEVNGGISQKRSAKAQNKRVQKQASAVASAETVQICPSFGQKTNPELEAAPAKEEYMCGSAAPLEEGDAGASADFGGDVAVSQEDPEVLGVEPDRIPNEIRNEASLAAENTENAQEKERELAFRTEKEEQDARKGRLEGQARWNFIVRVPLADGTPPYHVAFRPAPYLGLVSSFFGDCLLTPFFPAVHRDRHVYDPPEERDKPRNLRDLLATRTQQCKEVLWGSQEFRRRGIGAWLEDFLFGGPRKTEKPGYVYVLARANEGPGQLEHVLLHKVGYTTCDSAHTRLK